MFLTESPLEAIPGAFFHFRMSLTMFEILVLETVPGSCGTLPGEEGGT